MACEKDTECVEERVLNYHLMCKVALTYHVELTCASIAWLPRAGGINLKMSC